MDILSSAVEPWMYTSTVGWDDSLAASDVGRRRCFGGGSERGTEAAGGSSR